MEESQLRLIEETGLGAIRKASEVLKRYQDLEPKVVRQKSDNKDITTDVDLHIEKAITEAIKAKFPEHGFNAEEAGQFNKEAEFIWVIDPLDGTKNFYRGIPILATAISCKRKSQTLFAAIAIHYSNILIHGTRGKGVFRNGRAVRVSDTQRLSDSFVYTLNPTPWAKHPPSTERISENLKIFNKLTYACYRVRNFGSASIGLALTASGAFDAVVNLYGRGGIGDTEAGLFLVEEAGGRVSNLSGDPWTSKDEFYVASNGKLHDELLKVLN
ncbi:MAG: inositol monophosphatase [bacterium]|nr:inositol monophosphatase [bacterium]